MPTLAGTWVQFTDLASLGTNIMRLDFYSIGTPCVDDMTLIAPPLGALRAVRLQLPQTTCQPTNSQQATVLADYASVSNVIATIFWSTTFSSSDTNILTVTTNGLVKALRPGTATISATLSNVTSSVSVTVTALPLQYSVSGANLTFNWQTNYAAGYILQSSAMLAPSPMWTTVTNARTTVGSNYQIQVPVDPATPAAFYRLRLQP